MRLSVLYRGPLSSCNYACSYCPFAKRRESAAELAADRAALERFTGWVAERADDRLSIFFTPWGEALVRRWYRDAMMRLTRLEHVERVVAQTNLSCGLGWLDRCDRDRLALWCSYHPTQVTRARFLARCLELHRRRIRFSVGVVGLMEHVAEIEALRAELPPDVYLWVNAFKRRPGAYADEGVRRLERVDPHFRGNLADHPSRGRRCATGESVIAVDGDGTIRRCHFVPSVIGNIYQPGFEASLFPRPCPRLVCRCHIGAVHLESSGLGEIFAGGMLERIPATP